MYPPQVEILNQEIDPQDKTSSYFRILVNRKHIKYIPIDPGIYNVDDLCFPPGRKAAAISQRRLELGGESRKSSEIQPHSSQRLSRKILLSITPLWRPKTYEYLSFQIGERLRSNVYMASSPQFERPIIAKFARFHGEIGYYVAETRAYSWIDGHNIGPEFLGYITEDGRVIGFLIEFIQGRHAAISDLPACEVIVRELHALGILHGDLNKHNLLIAQRGAVLVDFETAERSESSEAMEKEVQGLEEQLLDQSGNGGVDLEEEDT